MVLRLSAWIGLIVITAWMWATGPGAHRRAGFFEGSASQRDVVYREVGGRRVRLDVHVILPTLGRGGWEFSDLRPAVLAIHGGSWTGGSKSNYGPQVERLAQAGLVVFVPDYKLARPGEPSWPEALEDLRAAVRWIRAHAAEYRVDPDRIVAFGSGAGGHLAALLGTDPPTSKPPGESSRVQAVVSLYGPTDLAELRQGRTLANDPIGLLIGSNGPDAGPALRAASPIEHVSPDDPPMLLLHGSDDLWVPPIQSRVLADRLRQAGVDCRLIVVPGARHGFEMNVEFPEKRDLLPEILAFLESVWHFPLRERLRAGPG
jgi:acetyl esterase/lipase